MDDERRLARETLLRRLVLEGEEAAWAELTEGAFRPLYAFVHARVGRDRFRADEAAQETWRIAVERIGEFRPSEGAFAAWLQGIARNVLRNSARKRARDGAQAAEPQRVETLPVPDESRARETSEEVLLALTTLPATYQEVLRAKYAEGRTLHEIAGAARLSTKAAESLLARARSAFRVAFERLKDRNDD